jgi:hypothetical protein
MDNNKIEVKNLNWIEYMLFIIAMASVGTCCNTQLIYDDVNEIKIEVITSDDYNETSSI